MKELIKKLNDLKIKQHSWDVLEQLYEDDVLTEDEISRFETVAIEINTVKHRWYDISTNVYKTPQGLLGVRFVSDTRGNTEYPDVGHILNFMEMEEIKVVSYKKKEQ